MLLLASKTDFNVEICPNILTLDFNCNGIELFFIIVMIYGKSISIRGDGIVIINPNSINFTPIKTGSFSSFECIGLVLHYHNLLLNFLLFIVYHCHTFRYFLSHLNP